MNMRCVFRTQRHSQRTQLLDELHLLVTLLFPCYPPLSAAFAMALFSSPSPPPQPTSAESIPQTRGSWADWLDEERAEHRGMSVEEYNLLMARDFKLFGLSTENIEWLQSGVVNGRCSIPNPGKAPEDTQSRNHEEAPPTFCRATERKFRQNYSHRMRKCESGCPVHPKRSQLPQIQLRGGTQLFLKTLSGKTIVMVVDANDTVSELKTAIRDRTGVPEDCQRLVCGGRDLAAHHPLADVRPDSTIFLLLRLRGGASTATGSGDPAPTAMVGDLNSMDLSQDDDFGLQEAFFEDQEEPPFECHPAVDDVGDAWLEPPDAQSFGLDAPEEISSSRKEPDGVPNAMGARKKYHRLDPKSQADLDERVRIPNALTSKDTFQGMFGSYKTKWAQLSHETHGIEAGKIYDVLTLTEQNMDFVRKEMPAWSDNQVRLGAAAVHLYNRRLSDLSERDYVHILWMCAGEHLVRVHEGEQLFVYQAAFGYWRAFEGLPPPHLFEVIRQFFVMLEGTFRNFKGHIRRDDKAVLRAMDNVMQGKSVHELLSLCESACAWNKGNHLLKKDTMKKLAMTKAAGGAADGAAPEEVGNMGVANLADFERDLFAELTQVEAAPVNGEAAAHLQVGGGGQEKPVQAWYIVVAQAISRFSPGLIKKLEHGKIIPFLSEWCMTPKKARCGCVFKDCIVYYDVDDKPMVYQADERDHAGRKLHAARSPSANLYVGIERTLLDKVDPVLQAAMDRLEKIYSSTFWAIPMAFQFGQACLALAKRGLNINPITLYLGPGGVGLSKYTAHLEAMLGEDNHCTFDPNIFYTDDELRKQVPNMAGHFVFTGQERPTGGKQPIREDLLKKFSTGEGICGRLPYGILTKMHHIIGWKRLESNKLIEFHDITEDNFESILRRFAVVQIQVRFYEEAQLDGLEIDADTRGVFSRGSELDAFYVWLRGAARQEELLTNGSALHSRRR